MLLKIREYVQVNKMFEGCDRIVVGFSGGADSLCLLLVLTEICPEDVKLVAVHINHGIRGAEALRDLDFCREFCRNRDIEFCEYSYDVPAYAKEQGITVEEAGRNLRYAAFNEVAGAGGRIAVAHHKNDQAETVLFNICRGSGIKGAGGMQPVRDNVIRPLLCVTRDEIENYLSENGLDFCQDSTNAENDYTRNCMRNLIVPTIQTNINSNAVENIAAFAKNASEAENYLEKLTEAKFRELVTYTKNKILLKRLETVDEYMAKRLIRKALGQMNRGLKDIGMVHVENVYGVLGCSVGTVATVKFDIKVERSREGLLFYRDGDIAKGNVVDVTVPSVIEPWEGAGKFEFSIIPATEHEKITKEVYTKYFDYDKIKIGLQLRNWESGDVIAIDDEGHHKKLKQYFVDEKMSVVDKAETVILADGKDIVWVVGRRIGANYKVTEFTKRILKVVYGGKR